MVVPKPAPKTPGCLPFFYGIVLSFSIVKSEFTDNILHYPELLPRDLMERAADPSTIPGAALLSIIPIDRYPEPAGSGLFTFAVREQAAELQEL